MTTLRLFLVSALLVVPWLVRAAEQKPGTADDSLAITKRELEAMKNQRLSSPQTPRIDLPQALDQSAMPDLRLLPEISDTKKKQEELRRKGKTGNWLIDGVQKNSSRGSSDSLGAKGEASSRSGSEIGEKEEEIDPLTGKPVELNRENSGLEKPDRNERGRDAKAEKPPPPVDNPLNRYMGDWLSPQDFTLLKKSGDAGPAGRFDGPTGDANIRGLPDPNSGFSAAALSARSGTSSAPAVAGIAATPRENPYLQSIAGPPVGGPSAAFLDSLSPATPAALPPPPPSYSPPAPIPETKSGPSVPDNLKRSEDAKYFPQLKRF